jgi:hypothetical protein
LTMPLASCAETYTGLANIGSKKDIGGERADATVRNRVIVLTPGIKSDNITPRLASA